jgi:hypothetical protein
VWPTGYRRSRSTHLFNAWFNGKGRGGKGGGKGKGGAGKGGGGKGGGKGKGGGTALRARAPKAVAAEKEASKKGGAWGGGAKRLEEAEGAPRVKQEAALVQHARQRGRAGDTTGDAMGEREDRRARGFTYSRVALYFMWPGVL